MLQANSSDNIGRVYALLGFAWEAFTSIQEGLELRQQQALPYREALSLNSLALYYLLEDNVHEAIVTIEQALTIFRKVGIERGEALALTTRGVAYRIKAEAWREQRVPIDDAFKDLETAEVDLRAALRVFATTVEEPLRRVHVENELACLYRARYLLLRDKGANERELQSALISGVRFFNSADQNADEFGFPIEKLDNLQDRAVLYERSADYSNVFTELDKVRQAIPNDHQFFKDRGLGDLSPKKRVDAYFKLMGMVELLHGATIYDQGSSAGNLQNEPSQEIILEMMEHYVLAIAYFYNVAGVMFANRRTYDRIYRRLRQCEKPFLKDLRDREIPQWIKSYQLPREAVEPAMEEIFRFLLQFRPGV